jgi:hypothetical protein
VLSWGDKRCSGTYGLGDVDLRYFSREEAYDLRHRSDFKTRANADEEIRLVAIVVNESLVEGIRKLFTKKGDVRLLQQKFSIS